MSLVKAREQLHDLDPAVRRRALERLVSQAAPDDPRTPPVVNLHCHTIFSYSGYGHSPASLAWLAREQGWYALGTVDFDVLDGVDETLWATDLVGVRGVSGLETRVHWPEYLHWEFNSPGEPGVIYFEGIGFAASTPAPAAVSTLDDMRQRAAQRNREMVERVNAHLHPVIIDYEADVLPLTPLGNATERHILVAYDAAARERYPQWEALVSFWADKLGMAAEEVEAFLGGDLNRPPAPHDAIRSRLMKRGGVGYVQPGTDTFPALDEVIQAILACGAMPCHTWLDGTSEGEKHLDELMPLLIDKGVAALTVIPDRNWNIADPDERTIKVRNFHEIMGLARDLAVPVLAGTEMNKAGQRDLDDFDVEPLQPYRDDLIQAADIVYGHTVLQRALGLGYVSDWAQAHLPDRRGRNAYYAQVGRTVAGVVPNAGTGAVERVAALDGAGLDADALLRRLGDMFCAA